MEQPSSPSRHSAPASAIEHKDELEKSWQQMRVLADKIPGMDRFKRSEIDGKHFIEDKNGKMYSVELLNGGDREQFQKLGQELHDFNNKFFDSEENDRPEDYQAALEGNFSDFYAIRDGEGRIVSLLNSQPITISGEGATVSEEMLLGWYVSTDDANQNSGVAVELLRQAYVDFIQQAKNKKVKTAGVVGETEPEVEGYFNKSFDLKRAYYGKPENSLVEVPYHCAPSYEDSSPSHLMFKFADERTEISREELLRTVGAIYREYTRADYVSDDTADEIRIYNGGVDALFTKLRAVLESAQNDKIVLLSRTEKKRLRASGTKILELENLEE